jgi:hypothetical protein
MNRVLINFSRIGFSHEKLQKPNILFILKNYIFIGNDYIQCLELVLHPLA